MTLSICNMFINTTKDSKSIVEYMQAIKKIVDDLALNGLDNDFKEINATIWAKDSPVTFE